VVHLFEATGAIHPTRRKIPKACCWLGPASVPAKTLLAKAIAG